MAEKEFDLIVIGGGSGGVRTARWAAGLGARVAICEEERFGGTCVLRGCIPKKLMVYAAEFSEEIEVMRGYGQTVGRVEFDWGVLKENRDREVARLSGLYEKTLESTGVHRFYGRAKLSGANEVTVNEQRLRANAIVVATGSRPWVPQAPGVERALVSDDFFRLEKKPRSAVVVGGGYIGLEFAGILHGLGIPMELVLRRPLPLAGFDLSCRHFLLQEIRRKGVNVHTDLSCNNLEEGPEGMQLVTCEGKVFSGEKIFFATGRMPNTQDLGLEEAGVKLNEKGAIEVNDFFQSSVPSIYALGDCIDKMNLTPVATAQGTRLAENLFAGTKQSLDYDLIPSAVFSRPPLASVGPTEQKAVQEHGECLVYESEFRPLKFTLCGQESALQERSYLKLIVKKSDQRVLAAHMVGKDAPEIMQGVAVAIQAKASKKHFDQTIGIHPSSAEEFVTLRKARAAQGP